MKGVEEDINKKDNIIKIKQIEESFIKNVCNEFPNAFWQRKQHIIDLPYNDDFNDKNITTKARPIQMNHELVEMCKLEIKNFNFRFNEIQESESDSYIDPMSLINAETSTNFDYIQFRRTLDGIRAMAFLDLEDERVMNLDRHIIIYRPGRLGNQ